MFATIQESIARVYDTFLGKVLILGLPIAACPVVILSMIHNALQS